MRLTPQFGDWRRSIVDIVMTPPILHPLFQSLACICSRAAGNEELSIRQARRSSGFSCEEDEIRWVIVVHQDSGVKNMKLDGSLRTTTAIFQLFCVLCRRNFYKIE
jgi:hypothetical protein